MEKKRLAYVDYWSHKYTKSGDFLREIFSEEFEITDFWWKPNEKISLNEINKFEYIFFFHVMFPHQIMKKLSEKKIMWAPMYDALNFRNSFFRSIFWKQITNLGIKVLKFSDKITESIGKEEVDSLKLNYFIKPNFSSSITQQTKLNIFFWDRGRIKIDDWLYLFDQEEINQIVYFPQPDPGKKIVKNDNLIKKKNYNINLIDKKFLPKSVYLSLFEKCNVFIAPRKKEGIGITIVEAISKGMFIVGYNDSTMNEYVSDKKIGFIFDEKTKEKINAKYIIENYEHRKKYAELSYNKWIQSKKKIIPLLKEETKTIKKIHFFPLFLIDDIKFLIKKIFNINFFYYH
jgi:glycosyltransferase involved in cell wall biosynthesis